MPEPAASPADPLAAAWAALLALKAGAPPPPLPAGSAADWVAFYRPYLADPGGRRPLIVAHLGQSLDGRIATAAGESRWITGAADLDHAHRMRALADAVLVGAGTVAHDDPRLTVRRVPGPQPLRVVLDAERRLSPDRAVFQDGAAATLLVVADDRLGGPAPGGAEVMGVPRGTAGLDLGALLVRLAARGVGRLFVEGGGVTVSRFLAAGLLDRLQIVVAPVIIGSGRPALDLAPIAALAEAKRPRMRRLPLGEDMLFECIFTDG